MFNYCFICNCYTPNRRLKCEHFQFVFNEFPWIVILVWARAKIRCGDELTLFYLISIYFRLLLLLFFESDLFFLVFIYVLALDMVRDLTINTENNDQEVSFDFWKRTKKLTQNANFRQKLHSKMQTKSKKTETDQRYHHIYSPFSLLLCDNNNLIWTEEEKNSCVQH